MEGRDAVTMTSSSGAALADTLHLRGVTPTVAAVVVYIFGLLCMYGELALAIYNFPSFVGLYALTFLAARPRRAISPLAMFYVYYGVWFVVTPMFAEIYSGGALHRPEYQLSFALAYTVFGMGVIAIQAGERFALRLAGPDGEARPPAPSIGYVQAWIVVLFFLSTLWVTLIVASSGGLERWIKNPGDAFLNRAGSGVFVILSHFCSLALAALSGYLAYRTRRKLPLVAFLLWVAVTSPVHGSKGQISLLVILAVLPWLKDMRLFSPRAYTLYATLLGVFFLGVYFRNLTWIETSTIIPYALNYFTALENLAMSVRDFEPQFMLTFFLPFVKFLTPFGLKDPAMYFDMNHMLTDHYYPHAWEIRATEQWPVETDLYLNFYFAGGLPLVALYLFAVAAVFGTAVRSNTLGAWFAGLVLTVLILSHMRGSLINHTDFYMYPYILFMYFVLRPLTVTRDGSSGARR
jgi:hypothetical protein